MKIKENSNRVVIDESCNLEVEVLYPSLDGVTAGSPTIYLNRNVMNEDGKWVRTYMGLSPSKAIKLAKLLRDMGKEVYAKRIEND